MIGSVECVLKQPFTYDALGRMTSRQAVEGIFPATPQAVTYTGFDKVSKVKQGSDSLCYAYGYDRQRILMEEHVCGLTRTKQYWGACEYVTESDGSNTSSLWRTFVAGPYGVFAVVETRNGTDEIHYVLKDNLGSWTTITDEHGNVEQRLSYDPWGNLRDPDTWANYTPNDVFNKPMFDRGYTGHEHLSAFGLINMNGRMYDPVMSSFLSADRFVQNPMTAMGFNRYAYCMNNPLRYVDPSGWLAGGGGPGGSLPHVIIGGQTNYILPEVTVKPDDNPSLSNQQEKPNYPTYYYGGSPTDIPTWGDPSNGPSIGWSNGTGCGGGNGNHGGGNQSSMISIEIQKTIMNYVVQYELFNIALGNKIASYAGSDFNKKMFLNYWYGKGDYELSSSEFEDIVSFSIQTKEPYLSEWNGDPAFAVPVTLYGTTYDNAIGTTIIYYDLDGTAMGIHEPYDFNVFPIRDSRNAQIKTTLVWGASLYNVHNKDFYINYNYHP